MPLDTPWATAVATLEPDGELHTDAAAAAPIPDAALHDAYSPR